MKIEKISIKNYRSIVDLELKPQYLCALVGENNSGKSNILTAINLLLGESWPTIRHITDDDIYNKETQRDIEIKIWFDQKIPYQDATGKDFEISGFLLKYSHYKRQSGRHTKGDPKIDVCCIDNSGKEIEVIKRLPKKGSGQRPHPEILYLTSEWREMFPVVFIGVNRDLKYHLSGSQWTLFGKLLKEIEKDFISDNDRKNQYISKMNEISALLRIPIFQNLENLIEQNVKKQTGFSQAKLNFKDPQVIDHYKNLVLTVKESDEYGEFSALEMGMGIQSAIVIALIQAYKELQKSGGILLIEEPEVYLHPHTRRFFYQLLKSIAEQGNQVFYTTHSVEFVDLSNFDYVTVVRKDSTTGTKVFQPLGLSIQKNTREELKLLTEFDYRRNELFFARKVLLVEGPTEKYSLPYAFNLFNVDINERGISIVDSGGKENIPFFIKIISAFGIPFVVLHDEDRNANNYNTYHNGPNGLNKKIEQSLPSNDLVFKMDPDFEGIFQLSQKSILEARNKLKSLTSKNQIPQVLQNAITKLLAI